MTLGLRCKVVGRSAEQPQIPSSTHSLVTKAVLDNVTLSTRRACDLAVRLETCWVAGGDSGAEGLMHHPPTYRKSHVQVSESSARFQGFFFLHVGA